MTPIRIPSDRTGTAPLSAFTQAALICAVFHSCAVFQSLA
jgi:hypothetical protein